MKRDNMLPPELFGVPKESKDVNNMAAYIQARGYEALKRAAEQRMAKYDRLPPAARAAVQRYGQLDAATRPRRNVDKIVGPRLRWLARKAAQSTPL